MNRFSHRLFRRNRQTRRSRQGGAPPVPTFEGLESRVLMSVTASLDGAGILTINGTEANEVIRVSSQTNGTLTVEAPGVNTSGTGNANIQDFTGVLSIVVNAGAGNDKVVIAKDLQTALGTTINAQIAGAEGNDVLIGGSGNDTITGGDGNDRIVDVRGNNTVDAGLGNDVVITGEGNDSIDLGDGNDVARERGGTSNTVGAGAGNDLVIMAAGTNSVDLGAGNDTFLGGSGDDSASGGEGNDRLLGRRGDDLLEGDLGDDREFGGSGNDTCHGGEGNDRLIGGRDDDDLEGGDDNDTVNGGQGQDTSHGGDGNDNVLHGQGDVFEDEDDQDVNETEPNNDAASANAFTLSAGHDTNLRGTASSSTDDDMFKFTAPSAGELEIEIKDGDNLVVTVEDSEGNVLLTVNSGDGEGALLVTQDTEYFIRVHNTTDSPVTYKVQVSLDTEDEHSED